MTDSELPHSSRSFWNLQFEICCVLIPTALILFALGYFGGLETATLRKELMTLEVRALTLSLILIIAPLLALFSKIHFRPLRRNERFLLVAGAGMLTLLALLPPRRSLIYWDEHIYMGIAQAIAHLGTAASCLECDAEFGDFQVFSAEMNKQPIGFPFYLAIIFRLFGVSETVAYGGNTAAWFMGVLAVGGVASLLYRSKSIGIIAGFLFASTPMVLRWMGTASAEMLSATLCSLSLLVALLLQRSPSLLTASLFAGVTGWMLTVRPENILHIVPILILLAPTLQKRLLSREMLFAFALLTPIAIVEALHLYAVRNERWGAAGSTFSLAQFWSNLPVNGGLLLFNNRFPLFVTILASIGLAAGLWRRRWNETLALLFWFLWSWGVFLFFYAGSYDYGSDVRFSVLCVPPLVILAASGLDSTISNLRLRERAPFLSSIIFAFGIVSLISFLPLIRAESSAALEARLDAEFVSRAAGMLPVDALVLSHAPHLWLVHEKNAAQSFLATTNQPHIEGNLMRRYRGGVFFHYGFWCNVPDRNENLWCQEILGRYNADLVHEEQGRGYRYGLYRLSRKM